MTIYYFVRSFELVDVGSSTLAVSDRRVWKVGSAQVHSLLAGLQKFSQQYIKRGILEDLIAAMDLPVESSISFLRDDIELLFTLSPKFPKFEHVLLFTDIGMCSLAIQSFMAKNGIQSCEIAPSKEAFVQSLESSPRTFGLVFLEHYDSDFFSRTTEAVTTSHSSGHLLSYMVGGTLHIDNPYMARAGLPNHGDHMKRWERLDASGNARSEWLRLLRHFRNESQAFINPYRIDVLEASLCVFHLIKYASRFVGISESSIHINDLLQPVVIDLGDGARTTYQVHQCCEEP